IKKDVGFLLGPVSLLIPENNQIKSSTNWNRDVVYFDKGRLIARRIKQIKYNVVLVMWFLMNIHSINYFFPSILFDVGNKRA
ncbi:MAG: hypothetical protein CVU00_02895, partial [Bacteroidetes bacterium HGW-Bacteroidetes-17]